MAIESTGQDKDKWTNEWKSLSVESEIQMWDYFGLRPWILKYVPRKGIIVEAGCGLGRYVFLLTKLGIDIDGIDFSDETIEFLNKWKVQNNYDGNFLVDDVTKLHYSDNSISGYLSFGVVEHFYEGPQKPIEEAFRVLKPGGIAIITTPSKSWFYYFNSIRVRIRNTIKRLIGRKIVKPPFFQYWYSPKQLKQFVEEAGFTVVRYSGADVLYTFNEYCRLRKKKIETKSWIFKLSMKLEKTFVHRWGAQSVVIAVKPEEKMHCFLCGELEARLDSLRVFDVPICQKHYGEKFAVHYDKKNNNPHFVGNYCIQKQQIEPQEFVCEISGEKYTSDRIFENFGFTKNIHPDLLKKSEVNIEASNVLLQPIWRNRKSSIQ